MTNQPYRLPQDATTVTAGDVQVETARPPIAVIPAGLDSPQMFGQHQAVQWLAEWQDRGRMRRCGNLKIVPVRILGTMQWLGPVCKKKSFEVQPSDENGGGVVFGCPGG